MVIEDALRLFVLLCIFKFFFCVFGSLYMLISNSSKVRLGIELLWAMDVFICFSNSSASYIDNRNS